MIKKLAAGAIMTAYAGVAATVIGGAIRGPLAEESLPRDFAMGAALIGAGLGIRWAQRELGWADETRDAA